MSSIEQSDLRDVFKKHKGRLQDSISEKLQDISELNDLSVWSQTVDLQSLTSTISELLSQLHTLEVIAVDLLGKRWDVIDLPFDRDRK